MPTSEFEKKIHRWASLICCFGSYRCLVRVGSICNLLELDLQMPGRGWKHPQLVGIGFADAWPGLEASAICWNWICRCLVGGGSICNLLELDLQMPGRGWKHLQLAGIGFADAWSGSEASATCWNWICRCLAGVGIICNLLELDLQMPGRGWKHLQLVGIGFADAWSGSEASAICWNWMCRCLVRVGIICNLLKLDMQIHIGVNSGRGSIHNLLELDLQMPGQDRKHLQFASIGAADAWSGLEASATCWI